MIQAAKNLRHAEYHLELGNIDVLFEHWNDYANFTSQKFLENLVKK